MSPVVRALSWAANSPTFTFLVFLVCHMLSLTLEGKLGCEVIDLQVPSAQTSKADFEFCRVFGEVACLKRCCCCMSVFGVSTA